MHDLRFIGIGAVKSGSSWMASLLSQHPEVCMSSRKEIAYFNAFNFDGTENKSSSYGLDYYSKFWSNTDKVKGEVSPQYFYDEGCPKRIKEAFPDTHILIMLRNPKQVVYSHYLYEKFFNRSIEASISFIEALNKNPFLLKSALFSEQIKRYQKIFRKEKIHIYFLDEALKNKSKFSKQLYADIELDKVDFEPDYSSVNESKRVKSEFINRLIRIPSSIKKQVEGSFLKGFMNQVMQAKFFIHLVRLRNSLLDRNVERLNKPKLTLEEKNYLDNYFKKEIEDLELLLGVDLSRWKTID